MKTGRLEAFSDGVLAIIITIMVLEIKVPHGSDFSNLQPLIPKFLSYLLSFIYIGIYWNNHHHLFHAVVKVNGKVLWANLFLLFSLSLIPFSTAWMGENNFDKTPVLVYGLNLLFSALFFVILEKSAIKNEGDNSKIALALHSSTKEYSSIIIYITGAVLSFFYPFLAVICYIIVALIWIVPDRRIEKQLN